MEALEKLKIRLGITGDEKDDILSEYLSIAEDEIKLFINVETLGAILTNKQVSLAKIYYERDFSGVSSNVKSQSYSEGVVSESFTYKSPDEYNAEIDSIFDSIRRYRKVYPHGHKTITPTEDETNELV